LGRLHPLIFDLVVRMDAGHGFAGQTTRRHQDCQMGNDSQASGKSV